MSSEIVGTSPYRFQMLISRDELRDKVAKVASRLREEYRDKKPIFVGVLNGSFIYMADLIRATSIPCEVDFIKLSSYRDEMTSGKIALLKDVDAKLTGRHVILVEDIVDSGNSLAFLRQHIDSKNPASVVMTAMFIKQCSKAAGAEVEYPGMEIPDEFVVGYGLDYAQQWRQLPDLYALIEDK